MHIHIHAQSQHRAVTAYLKHTTSLHTWLGQCFQGIHHVLTVFGILILKADPSEVLEEDNGIGGQCLVLNPLNGRMEYLPQVEQSNT